MVLQQGALHIMHMSSFFPPHYFHMCTYRACNSHDAMCVEYTCAVPGHTMMKCTLFFFYDVTCGITCEKHTKCVRFFCTTKHTLLYTCLRLNRVIRMQERLHGHMFLCLLTCLPLGLPSVICATSIHSNQTCHN